MGKLEPKKCRFVDFSKRVVALKFTKIPWRFPLFQFAFSTLVDFQAVQSFINFTETATVTSPISAVNYK